MDVLGIMEQNLLESQAFHPDVLFQQNHSAGNTPGKLAEHSERGHQFSPFCTEVMLIDSLLYLLLL
jgi:hypothetical protein